MGSDESAGALVAPLPDVPLFTEVLSVTDARRSCGGVVRIGRAGATHSSLRLHAAAVWSAASLGAARAPVSCGLRWRSPFSRTPSLSSNPRATGYNLYSPDGLHLGDRPVRFGGCPSRAARDLASTQWGLLVLLDCMTESGREAQTLLEGTGGRFHAIAAYAPRQTGPRVVDSTLLPVVAAHPRGFLFGLAGEECLDLYGPEGDVLEPVCHGWIRALSATRRPWQTACSSSAADRPEAGSGSSCRISLPPFDRIFVDGDRLVYRAFTPREAMRLVVRDEAGGERTLSVPHGGAVFVHTGSALVAWDDMDGTRIGLYPLDGD